MTLTQFKKMWEEDGTKLVKESHTRINGATWYLYAVYFPESTEGYGRHMVMILKIDTKSKEILKHDLKNIGGELSPNGRQGVDTWFKEHVGRY